MYLGDEPRVKERLDKLDIITGVERGHVVDSLCALLDVITLAMAGPLPHSPNEASPQTDEM